MSDTRSRLRRGWTGLFFLVYALVGTPASAQEVTVRGFVSDAVTGQALQGANLVLQDSLGALRGAVSSPDGFYQIGRLAPGRYVLRASYIGYLPFADTLVLGAEPFVTRSLALTPSREALEEVVVATEGGAARLAAGQQTIRPADLERIPTPGAGGDLAGYLQSLPGVVAMGDRGGQLYIRGGTPSHNLVLVDGLPIYQPFHILGFFSAFPQELVSDVELYAGGFGARYSGRISSVIDVRLREGNKQRVEAAASVSPFLAGLRLEGPVGRGGLSLLGSFRRSLVESVGSGLLRESLPFRFGDWLVKLHHAGGGNSRCAATVMHTYDEGRIDPASLRDEVFRWKNTVLSGRCFAVPAASSVLFEVNSGLSYGSNAVGLARDPERSSRITQVSSEVHLAYQARRATYGGGFFVRMSGLAYRLSDQFTNARTNDDMLLSSGVYLEARVPVGTALQLEPGIAATVYPTLYSPALEPRFRFTWRPGGGDRAPTISGALGFYQQTIVGISDERDAGSMFLAWMPAPLGGAQARALHALLGWNQEVGSALRLSAEGYYKRLRNLHVPIWSTIARFTTRLALAEGSAYGVDVRATYQRGPVYAYVGYGLSWTEYTAAQENFGLWFGEPIRRYRPPHDRRHQVNSVLSLDLGRFQANLRWQFGTGLPFTRPLGFDDLIPLRGLIDVRQVYGVPRVLYERPYGGRLPAYHRLDVSVEHTFALPFGALTAEGGAVNVYDRANLFYYDVFTVRRVDQLPLLPYVSILLEVP